MIGKRFGKWTVLSRSDRKGRNVYFNVTCDCGSAGVVLGTVLRNGRSTKCKKCCNLKGPPGDRFGKLTVIERAFHAGRRKWQCLCDCGKTTFCTAHELRSGHSTQCKSCSTKVKNHKHKVRHRTTELGYESSVSEAANAYGIDPTVALSRLGRKRDPFTQPLPKRHVVIDGVVKAVSDVARSIGLKPNTVNWRINHGWTLEQALGTRAAYSNKVVKR